MHECPLFMLYNVHADMYDKTSQQANKPTSPQAHKQLLAGGETQNKLLIIKYKNTATKQTLIQGYGFSKHVVYF